MNTTISQVSSSLRPTETCFIPVSDQPSLTQYWGTMRFLGRMAPDTTMYAVDFADRAPHHWHYHEQAELIVVVSGSIQQLTGRQNGESITILEDRILHAGDAVFLAKGQWHAASPQEAGTKVVFTIKGGDGIYCAFERSDEVLFGPSE